MNIFGINAAAAAARKAIEAARQAAQAARRTATRQAQRTKPQNPGIASKKGENNFQADIAKSAVQKKDEARAFDALNKATGGKLQPALQRDAEARKAAKEVEQTYKIRTTPQARPIGQPPADTLTPQEATARRLREVTEKQSPEVAALTIKYAQPTIDRVTADLGRLSGQKPVLGMTTGWEDGGYGDSRPRFDNVINDLAAAANKASYAPNGKAAVKQVATSLVKNIDEGDIRRFDEALGKTIGNGTGGKLTAEVIKQLKAAGRGDQANDVLQSVQDGINQLRDRAKGVSEKVQELSWLLQQGNRARTDKQLQNAVEAYKKKVSEMDQLGVAVIRATNSFGDARKDFAGLDYADDVDNSLKDLLNDETTKTVVQLSKSAAVEIGRLKEEADNNPSEKNFFDNIAAISGALDDGKFLTEFVLEKTLDATISKSFNAADGRKPEEVNKQIQKLEKYAKTLGYDTPRLKSVFRQLERVSDAVFKSNLKGENLNKKARRELSDLAKKVKRLQETKPGERKIFSDGSQTAKRFNRLGLFISAAGLAGSGYQAINSKDKLKDAAALVDAAGLGNELAQRGAQTKIVSNILENKSWYSKLPFEAAGKALGGIGLGLDVIMVGKDLADGKPVDAAFNTAAAAGSMMILVPAASTGVGLVVVGAALIGKMMWDKHEDSVQYENAEAEAFWQGAGIKPEVAKELIDNDGDGGSPIAVFTAMATQLQANPKEFLDYVNTLSPDKVKNLVERAHDVDPTNNDDLNDFENWMDDNGYKVPRMAILQPDEGGAFTV